MESRHRIAEVLRSFDTAMLVTHARSGPLDVRPMQIAAVEIEAGGPIWFATSAENHTAMELAGDDRVLLVMQHAAGYHLALWGSGRVVDDPRQALRLWDESLRPWFRGGPDDPDLRLIAVDVQAAELWHADTHERERHLFDDVMEHSRNDR
jgi:general stress protein 26